MAKVKFTEGTLVSQTFKDVIVYGDLFQITATQVVKDGKIVRFIGNVEKEIDGVITTIGNVSYRIPYTQEDGMTIYGAGSGVNITSDTYVSLQSDVYSLMNRYITQEDSVVVTVVTE